jgi:hypothetical protein
MSFSFDQSIYRKKRPFLCPCFMQTVKALLPSISFSDWNKERLEGEREEKR